MKNKSIILKVVSVVLFVGLILGSVYYTFFRDKKVQNNNEKINWEERLGDKNTIELYVVRDNKLTSDVDVTNKKATYEYTCVNYNCRFIGGNDSYGLFLDGGYYLYDFNNQQSHFINVNNILDVDVFVDDNKLYGLALYQEQNEITYYSLLDDKVYYNSQNKSISPQSIKCLKDNRLLINDKMFDILIDLKTGDELLKDYTIHISDTENSYYYQLYSSEDNSHVVVTQNLRKLNGGREVNYSYLNKDNHFYLLEKDANYYEIRNLEDEIIYKSKTYDKVYMLTKGYIIVLKDNYLTLLDNNENIVAKYTKMTDNLYLHTLISGFYSNGDASGFNAINKGSCIYLVVENNSIDEGVKGRGIEYYYLPDTKEQGYIELTEIGIYAKPVLYLYPREKTIVNIRFNNPNLLTTTYPKYYKNWEVTAYPNGDLYDQNNKYYYGLYWEEETIKKISFDEGFYVNKDMAIDFLEEKLSLIGLNNRERNEFIMYWLPILEKNEHNLVYFELTESREKDNKLLITPRPDSMLRIAIHVKRIEGKINIKEQRLFSFKRSGFTIVEWGGKVY